MQPALDRRRWPPLTKRPEHWTVVPNLVDYDQTRATFSWASARQLLDGLPGGRGLNIVHAAIDRHAAGANSGRVAFRWIGRSGELRNITYADLGHLTNRYANVLRRLGIGKGDVVVALAGRIPELYIAALGTLKAGAIFSPVLLRVRPGADQGAHEHRRAKVLVTTDTLYRQVEPHRTSMPDLEHVLLVGESGRRTSVSKTGTTGLPKGAMHVHEAVVAHHITASSRWTSIPRTSSGARPTRAG
jgi:acetyl-CoA synthetase